MQNLNKLKKKKRSTHRVIIYPKDIQLLTGKSYRHALYLNKEIREHYKKEKHHLLTIKEFAAYTGIRVGIIKKCLS